MNNVVYVATGEVKAGKAGKMLISSGIGSCIAVILYDKKSKLGAMAHIMLPGKAPNSNRREKMKYAYNALNEMLRRLAKSGARMNTLLGFIVGGGNVLCDKKDTVCKSNIKSVTGLLKINEIKIIAKAIGGTKRRSVSMDISSGIVRYSEGDSQEKILWKSEG